MQKTSRETDRETERGGIEREVIRGRGYCCIGNEDRCAWGGGGGGGGGSVRAGAERRCGVSRDGGGRGGREGEGEGRNLTLTLIVSRRDFYSILGVPRGEHEETTRRRRSEREGGCHHLSISLIHPHRLIQTPRPRTSRRRTGSWRCCTTPTRTPTIPRPPPRSRWEREEGGV